MDREPLNEIIENYENTRRSYREFTKKGDNNKEAYVEFESKFVDLKASLRYWRSKMTGEYTKRDDKSATAIKFRIAVAISEGNYTDEQGKPIYDSCSITSAEKYASGSKEYRKFVEERSFYRASLTNISDLRDDINSYILEIKDKIKL